MQKVLLVEDDLGLVNYFSKLLFSEGYDVLVARDAQKALSIALQEDLSLILLDIMLASRSSGMDVLRVLKSKEECKNIPVVMLTNVAKDMEKEDALNLGAKEYLIKARQHPKDVVRVIKKYANRMVKTKSGKTLV